MSSAELSTPDGELSLVSPVLTAQILASPSLHRVQDEYGGSVFGSERGDINYWPDFQKIATRGGFTFSEATNPWGGVYTSAHYPDPERLLACSKANDIPIRFVSDTSSIGDIPGDVFEDIIRSRHHPVGVDNQAYYMHDTTGVDHFPAIIVGGRPLIEWIVKNTPASKNLADIYDTATSYITHSIRSICEADEERMAGQLLRRTVDLFKGPDESIFTRTKKDELLEKQLKDILYSGLKKCNIHRPELVTNNRWNTMARSVIWATIGK